MSTAQNEKIFVDGENYGQRNLQHKQINSERKHTVRKHALGEIKNVIHNQGSVTPFRGLQAGSSKSFCSDLLKKQTEQLKSQVDNRQKLEQAQNIQPIAITKTDELEKINFPSPRTCNEECHKSLDEIWSEMNVLESDILKRIINSDGEADNDYMHNSSLMPIDFEDELDPPFDLQDPYELEEKKLLQSLLAKDYECVDFPSAVNWIDDL